MKILHGLIGFVLSLAMLALGWTLAANALDLHPAYWQTARDLLQGSRISQFVLGVTLLTLVVLFWLSALPIGRREHFLSFDSEGGMISISVNAINAFLAKLKTEFAGILDLRSAVTAARNGAIEVRLDMKVKAGVKIQQLSQALQQRVRDSMRESLGIEDVAGVKVNVLDIVATGEAPPPPPPEWQDNT